MERAAQQADLSVVDGIAIFLRDTHGETNRLAWHAQWLACKINKPVWNPKRAWSKGQWSAVAFEYAATVATPSDAPKCQKPPPVDLNPSRPLTTLVWL